MLVWALRANLAVWLAIGAFAADAAGVEDPVGLVLCAIAAAMASIGSDVAATFVIAAANRDAADRARPFPLAERLGLWIGEWLAVCATFLLLQPFHRLLLRFDPPATDGPPVLLVHGYCENAGVFWLLARRLRRAGYAAYLHDLGPVFGDIDGYAPALAARIEEISARHGRAAVAAVGHSMGGLALRACARRPGPHALARIVTLGTPHGGTALAELGLGANARQMRRGGPWLQDLARDEAARPWPQGFAVRTLDDNIVAPASAAEWPGASNAALDGVGHVALAFSRAAATLVVAALAAPAER